MSEDFIPLNQSTPTSNKFHNQSRIHNRGIHVLYHQNQNQSFNHSGPRRSFNQQRRGNKQRNSSFGSDSNNSSYSQDGPPIDAYIHPAMLQDPWAQLRKKLNKTQ